MLFYSYEFIFVFMPVALAGCAILQHLGQRATVIWLSFMSAVFYINWRAEDFAVISLSMIFNFVVGARLGRSPSRALLVMGIAVNLAVLGYFKYTNFIVSNITHVLGGDFDARAIALPLGISFFTFQKIAYLVDSYRRRTINHGFAEFSLFVLFFPQLIAGPIVHQSEMLRQFRNSRSLRIVSANLAVGLTIFAAGLFKKLVMADAFAGYATPTFDAVAAGQPISFSSAWAAALCYTFQIYFDFSAYSDMAIGLARMFGVRLPVNFLSPYQSVSIIEFWRRWHITLSRFLRDYLYFPLGGNRHGRARTFANLLIVMLLGGLWHGASWTFVIWGALHGAYLGINHLWRGIRQPSGEAPSLIATGAGWACTFTAVVVAWVFFRAADVKSAIDMLACMVGMGGPVSAVFPDSAQIAWIVAGLLICLFTPNIYQIMIRSRPALGKIRRDIMFRQPVLVWKPNSAWALSTGSAFAAALAVYWFMDTPPVFIYFNF